MAIVVDCECGETFRAGGAFANRRVRCPGCVRGVVVPPRLDALFDDSPEPLADATYVSPERAPTRGRGICRPLLRFIAKYDPFRRAG